MARRRHGLSQRRKAVGFTQESFAEHLNVERTTVVRWEAGETEPLPWVRPKMARALDVSIDQLAQLLSEAEHEKAGSEAPWRDVDEPVGEPVAPSQPVVLSSFFPARGHTCVDPDGDMLVMQSFRAADKKVGGGHLYATVVNYLHTELAPRLVDVTHGADSKEVFISAAALTEMAGWMAHDAGKNVRAQQHLLRALDLVKVGGDQQLAAHTYASMSHLAHHHHRPHQAIHLAHQGTQTLQSGPPQPPIQAQLFTMQAKGMAELRQTKECTRLLIEAEKALSRSSNVQELSPWVSHFDEGSFANEVACCMRALGDLGEAQRQAQRVLELRPRDRTRSRALGQLILVTVLIAQDDADQACALAQDVLDSTQSLGSYVVLQQLYNLKELLAPHQINKVVADFLACLDQVLRERLWLYQWLSKDERRRDSDFREGG